jgi:hypothetical protein
VGCKVSHNHVSKKKIEHYKSSLYNGTKAKTINAGGAAAAQDSSQVFPMTILLGLDLREEVKSREKKPYLVFFILFLR